MIQSSLLGGIVVNVAGTGVIIEPMVVPERSPEVSPERSPDDVASEASGSVSADDMHTRMGAAAHDSIPYDTTMRGSTSRGSTFWDGTAWHSATHGVETPDSTIHVVKSQLEGMETRLKDIEVRMDRAVQTNTTSKRVLEISAIVGLMGGLLTALLIFTLTTLNSRIDGLDQTIKTLDASVDTRFEKFEEKMDAKFEKIDTKFDKMDERMDSLQTTLETLVAVLEVQGKIPTGVVE